MDFVGFTPTQSGPGGAQVLNSAALGYQNPQAAGALPGGNLSPVAPQSERGFHIPPVVWAFVFILVGYIGLNACLRAV